MGSAARVYSGELGGFEPTPLERHAGFINWSAAVKRRGNMVTRFPSGPHKGKLAERYKDKQGALRYALPPMDVRAAEKAILAQEARDRAAGKSTRAVLLTMPATSQKVKRVVEIAAPVATWPMPVSPIEAYERGAAAGDRAYDVVRDAAGELRKDVAGVPRKALSELLGIPEWIIPIAAIGTGLILLSGLYDRVRE